MIENKSDVSPDHDADSVEPHAAMAARELRVMELLKTTKPERIEHELRNLLNELSLLRVLFDRLEEKDPTAAR